ncbi:hypothetical protein MMC21_006532 [Puttea exsequens]|nr:hypothetical protein [Puttea exsequens]
MPHFVAQCAFYEVRERLSKAYSWAAFLIANVFVEIPYQMFMGVLVWAVYYYLIYRCHQSAKRQGLVLLFCMQFFVFASTFAHMVIAALSDAETSGNIAIIMFSLSLIFNGVVQPSQALSGFRIFIYRLSPFTFLDGIATTHMYARPVSCFSAPQE